jgi:hypothetical protein
MCLAIYRRNPPMCLAIYRRSLPICGCRVPVQIVLNEDCGYRYKVNIDAKHSELFTRYATLSLELIINKWVSYYKFVMKELSSELKAIFTTDREAVFSA